MIPLRFGTTSEFAALRAYLLESGYTAAALCERFAVPSMYAFRTESEGGVREPAVVDRLDLLVRLFLDATPVALETASALLGERGLHLLEKLGLMDGAGHEPGTIAATVLLYPTEGLYIVSDVGTRTPRDASAPAAVTAMRADAVYPAITGSTRSFIRSLPSAPCERFLELCAGTGIAALIAARNVRHAWAVDITERSTRFAEFNALLNDLHNVTALQGDLYAPVGGLTFDRIVAHPPYVPSAGMGLIYAEGGRDGEELTCAIVAGLDRHLSPGGSFYCTCMGTDRKGAPFEARMRALLGERESEFDVLVLERQGFSARDFVISRAAASSLTPAQIRQQHTLYREIEAERALFCTLVIQRHERAGERPCFTVRRQSGGRAESSAIEWLLRWSALLGEPDAAERVLGSRPRISAHVRLRMTHQPAASGWEPELCQLTTEVPFPSAIDITPNAALLAVSCDGTLSVRERLQRLKSGGAVPDEMPEEAFVEFITRLVGEGIIELDGLSPAPLPVAAVPRS